MASMPTAAQPARNAELDALIYAERIGMLYRQLPTSVTGNMIGATVLAGIAYFHTQWLAQIAAWFACVAALQMSRLAMHLQFRRQGFVLKNVRRAAMAWAAGTAVSGVLWGSTAVLFFVSDQYLYQAALTVLAFGITASAIPLIGTHLPSFYLFVIPALVPFIVRNILEGGALHYVISFTEAAVMVGFTSFALNYNRMLIESLRNRFEKQALADRLAQQNIDLEQARVAAEQANRSKTRFFAAASHDLRQPLHAMGLFAAALAQKARDPEVTGVIASINASVQALEALFNELLDVSKIDSGVIKPNLTNFALGELFDRLRGEFAAEAASKGLQLSMTGAAYTVASDAVLLERILRNLLSNAIRYTAAGGISVVAAPVGGTLRIEVRDTGTGIRAADRQRIFEEFVQLGNPARTSKKGLGLGLSIVQRLCALLGYAIQVDSDYGKGSTFSFEVPLGTRPTLPQDAASIRAPLHADLAGKLVVVIDDESAILEGMQALLSGWGAEVLVSDTGDDVVAAVHTAGKLPALLIVDHRLGHGANGIAVAARIRRELDPEIPALLITGSISPDLAEQARAAGLGFLLKPVTADALRERVDSVLASSPSLGEQL